MTIESIDPRPAPVDAGPRTPERLAAAGATAHCDDHPVLRAATWLAAAILAATVLVLAWRLFIDAGGAAGANAGAAAIVADALASKEFWSAAAVGFLAQIVDGALGMAYGVTATTFLLGVGVTPAAASASVHIAEVFTTGISGIAHARLGNVDRSLFLRLLAPGAIGAVLGAVLVTKFDGALMKPFVSAWLLAMGLHLLHKARRRPARTSIPPRRVAGLALFGGFVDTAGGGGWGPVVSSHLIVAGHDPRTTIGSVNFAEFFLTLASAASFVLLAGEPQTWQMVAGLVFGGTFAAPVAALLCRRLAPRILMTAVGLVVATTSAWNLWRALA